MTLKSKPNEEVQVDQLSLLRASSGSVLGGDGQVAALPESLTGLAAPAGEEKTEEEVIAEIAKKAIDVPELRDVAELPKETQEHFRKLAASIAPTEGSSETAEKEITAKLPRQDGPAVKEVVEDSDTDPADPQISPDLHANCPYCGWVLADAVIDKPTEEDEAEFIVAVCGQQLFKKTYTGFADKIQLRFRELRASEVDLLFTVVRALRDNNNEPLPPHLLMERLSRYQLALQLVSFTLPDAVTTHFQPSLDKWLESAADTADTEALKRDPQRLQERLDAILGVIFEKSLVTETLQQFGLRCLDRFNRLRNNLEVHLSRSDFLNSAG